jgi:hypothetical protein
MRRKFEILAVIILLCVVACFIYYECIKQECIQTPQIKIIYYSMPSNQQKFDDDDISDTIEDEVIQHEQL